MNLDHFRKEHHVTNDLVEQLSIVAWEDIRARNTQTPGFPNLPWEKAPADDKEQTRSNVLAVLNMTIPVLIEQGWLPPTVNDAIREAVRDLSVNELHQDLMRSLQRHPNKGGHTTQEGIEGYSEGAEHGTISLAGRVKQALQGVQLTAAQRIAEANAAKVRRMEILANQLDAEGMNTSVVLRIWEALEPAK